MEKTSVLAISGENELLSYLRKILKNDYEIITMNNLLDGMDMLRESNFEILLLDEKMQWFSLNEAKRKLKDLERDVFIIAMISDDNEEKVNEMRDSGIYDYLLKPFTKKDVDRVIKHVISNLEVLKEKRELERKLSFKEDDVGIIGESKAIKEVKRLIDKVAESDVTVLITGENGSGKELVAREIYKKSTRKKKPYITVNCAAISSNLIEAELFGYEKGAFTGANARKKGIIEEADGGTLLLDEIGDLDLKSQAKLLRVIEYGELRRVGGSQNIKVDVRFIASTNKNLEEEVKKDKFRRDLFHRLSNFPIYVPPLRERSEDVPLLINYFLHKTVEEVHKDMMIVSGEAMKYLMDYEYPGNIRELKNIIERMVILSNDKIIRTEDLPLELKMNPNTIENKVVEGLGPLKEILEKEIYELDEVERVVIAMALQKTRWNKQETAKLLGVGRTTLYEKIRKYNLDRRQSIRKKD